MTRLSRRLSQVSIEEDYFEPLIILVRRSFDARLRVYNYTTITTTNIQELRKLPIDNITVSLPSTSSPEPTHRLHRTYPSEPCRCSAPQPLRPLPPPPTLSAISPAMSPSPRLQRIVSRTFLSHRSRTISPSPVGIRKCASTRLREMVARKERPSTSTTDQSCPFSGQKSVLSSFFLFKAPIPHGHC